MVGNRLDGRLVADQGDHRLAAEPHVALGQYRLILSFGKNSKLVGAGYVVGGQDREQARILPPQGRQIANRKTGSGVGRTHRPQPQGVVRRLVGAEHFAAVELGHAVDLVHRGADRRAHRRRGHATAAGDVEHGVDYLAVAGTAAQHAAEGVQGVLLGGIGIGRQQGLGGHQHARRTDAALGRAVALERRLQRRALIARRQALHGDHAATVRLGHGHQTGANRVAVEQHRTGATIAGVAADLGAGQAELFAQDMGQSGQRRRHGLDSRAVDRETGTHNAAPNAPRPRRIRVRAPWSR